MCFTTLLYKYYCLSLSFKAFTTFRDLYNYSRIVYHFLDFFFSLYFVSRKELDRFRKETIKFEGRNQRNSLDKEIHNLRITELVRLCKVLMQILNVFFLVHYISWNFNVPKVHGETFVQNDFTYIPLGYVCIKYRFSSLTFLFILRSYFDLYYHL